MNRLTSKVSCTTGNGEENEIRKIEGLLSNNRANQWSTWKIEEKAGRFYPHRQVASKNREMGRKMKLGRTNDRFNCSPRHHRSKTVRDLKKRRGTGKSPHLGSFWRSQRRTGKRGTTVLSGLGMDRSKGNNVA
jgi:hypothetical protein